MAADDRSIGAAVGIGQTNDPADVRTVQHLLNQHREGAEHRLVEDGIFGPRTRARLTEYQRDTVKLTYPDAVSDMHGPTMRALSRPVERKAATGSGAEHRASHHASTSALGPSLQDLLSSGTTKTTDRHPSNGREHLTHQQYIDEMLPHARAAHEKWGVPVSVMLAQGSVESAWGNRHPDNVYFGVKGYAPDGKSVMLMTHEEKKDGTKVLVPQRFRAYDSLASAADDYGRFLATNKRYKEAFRNPDDGIAFMKAVAAAGYASDSSYATTLEGRMRDHGMLQYDDHSPRLKPGPAQPPLPANRDVPAPSPVTTGSTADLQAYWKASAATGRDASPLRPATAFDPTSAAVASSMLRNGSDAALRLDLAASWKAEAQAGMAVPAGKQQQRPASMDPVATPAAPRMKR